MHLYLKKRPLVWLVRGDRSIRVTRLGRRPLLGMAGAVLLLWIPRIAHFSAREPTVVDQSQAADSLPVYQGHGVETEDAHFRMWPDRMIDGMISGKPGRDGRYSSNAAEYERGLSASPGDEVIVSIFFMNASATRYSTAHNTRLRARFETTPATVHEVSAAIAMDNGMVAYSGQPGMGGSLRIRTTVPTRLVYVPGSTDMCLSRQSLSIRRPPVPGDPTGACAQAGNDRSAKYVRLPDGIANEAVQIGDLPGLYSGILVFALKIEHAATN